MGKILAAIALTFNAVLGTLLLLCLALKREDITVRYFVTALMFTIINIAAIVANVFYI